MNTFIYFTSLVFKLCQKQFSQNLQLCEDGAILKNITRALLVDVLNVFITTRNGDQTIFFCDWHVTHRRSQNRLLLLLLLLLLLFFFFFSWAKVGAKIFGRR